MGRVDEQDVAGSLLGWRQPEQAVEFFVTRGSERVRAVGVDMHIGSQITDMKPFDNAFALLAQLVNDLRADGHGIKHVDVGGGLGIPYHHDEEAPPDPKAYAEVVKKHVKSLGVPLHRISAVTGAGVPALVEEMWRGLSVAETGE